MDASPWPSPQDESVVERAKRAAQELAQSIQSGVEEAKAKAGETVEEARQACALRMRQPGLRFEGFGSGG